MNYNDLIGTKYKVHGRNKNEGFDCYGLAIEVLKRNGIKLTDVFYEKDSDFERARNEILPKIQCEKVEKPRVNSLIEITCYGLPSHIGVYIGNGQMIHATEKSGVCIVPYHLYKNRVRGIYVINSRL